MDTVSTDRTTLAEILMFMRSEKICIVQFGEIAFVQMYVCLSRCSIVSTFKSMKQESRNLDA